MPDNSNELEITCPFCKEVGKINVPVSVYSNKKWGVVKIQVPAGAICKEHQFIVLIDTKGNVRGYERIEYLKGPESELKENVKYSISINDLIEIFGETGLIYLLHAKIFNYLTVIIRNKMNTKLENVLDEFFDRLFPEEIKDLNQSVVFIDNENIDTVEDWEDEALIIESRKNIVQIPWKEKLKFEESVIDKASEIIVKNEQSIILQQEISKFIKVAENAKEILEFYYDITKADFLDQLQKEARVPKITKNDLALYKLYIERRYSPHYWDKIKKK